MVVPPGVVTITPTVPARCAGVENSTVVGVIAVGVIPGPPSTDTVEPATKPDPVIVTS